MGGRLLQERLTVVTRRSASVSFLLYFNIFYQIFNFQELTLILSVSFFFSYCPLLPPYSPQFHFLPTASPPSSHSFLLPILPLPFHPLCCASLLSPSESCSSYVSVTSYQWGHELWNFLLFIYFVFFCAYILCFLQIALTCFCFGSVFLFGFVFSVSIWCPFILIVKAL